LVEKYFNHLTNKPDERPTENNVRGGPAPPAENADRCLARRKVVTRLWPNLGVGWREELTGFLPLCCIVRGDGDCHGEPIVAPKVTGVEQSASSPIISTS